MPPENELPDDPILRAIQAIIRALGVDPAAAAHSVASSAEPPDVAGLAANVEVARTAARRLRVKLLADNNVIHTALRRLEEAGLDGGDFELPRVLDSIQSLCETLLEADLAAARYLTSIGWSPGPTVPPALGPILAARRPDDFTSALAIARERCDHRWAEQNRGHLDHVLKNGDSTAGSDNYNWNSCVLCPALAWIARAIFGTMDVVKGSVGLSLTALAGAKSKPWAGVVLAQSLALADAYSVDHEVPPLKVDLRLPDVGVWPGDFTPRLVELQIAAQAMRLAGMVCCVLQDIDLNDCPCFQDLVEAVGGKMIGELL